MSQAFVSRKQLNQAKDYWKSLGPGLTTGAADDDPSGITTYSQAGAQFGFNFLWLAPYTFPLMAVVQEMCARIGLVTGRGLAANIRQYYPKWVLYIATMLLFAANTLNIGADLGAMAKASQLLFPHFSFTTMILGFTIITLALQIFTTYEKYAKYLKWLALVLLSYVFSALTVDINWNEALQKAIIPTIVFSKDQIFLITAVLGTTISPYLFFWQTSQEVEEQILGGKTTLKLRQEETTPKEVKNMRMDVWSGMFLSNLVMFFIIAAAAATLFSHGITNITSAAEAAEALRPIAGERTYLLFALGIIGTGMLAVPILAGSASYALSESFGWKFGLYRRLREANAFYGVIIIATGIGLGINLLGFDSIKVLIYSAVFNGLIAPVILVLIVLLSGNGKIMGRWVNGKITTFFGWLIVALMTLAGAATIISLFL
ncbi:iron transporter [Candidatus Daviesbacteria bacterium RIFCSPLOWO2_01_FULL_41_32]|uniref:Iron transporter n=1 Tax=Candidatus Daviesbacteria bacterium RIFCSPHIGHO2_01_FULL_41_23 TaxID=1797764 RepID=A0A1F5IQT4_9BACT|nr:MAG: iron transporter [Candidatus Daviesbacteria bacterium RIFCSPHIGHO2_01_FULL_41_23]OGE62357.1 MAG: iron transporter [Candidatus Daviesbacteria bacterium RIFCSPLOWO2_01_FULL_41_32]